MRLIISHSILKFLIFLFSFVVLLLASLFGYVGAQEVHVNGFGGITPFNNTGLTIFDDSLMRSSDYESDSLVLSAEFSILETNGDVRDFSLFDNDLTLQNVTIEEPFFVDSMFRTALETIVYVDNATFSPTDDTYAREDTPDSTQGGQTSMNVASFSGGTGNRRAFVEYDISSIPASATVTTATLEMYAATWGGSFPRNYDAQRITASWDESTLTWNNQPTTTGTNYTTAVQGQTGLDIWTITDMVEGWHSGAFSNYGLRIRDDTENEGVTVFKTYYSKEFGAGAPDPVLEVTWVTGSQWAEAAHSESLDMENTNVSMVWWGQIADTEYKYVAGKGCSASIGFVYGLVLDAQNQLTAAVSSSACVTGSISSNLPTNGLSLNQTYGIGVVFEDNSWGADVHFWLDGQWIYNDTSTVRVGDSGVNYYVGRSAYLNPASFCNCTHDEVLVFKERLTNDTMKLLTTRQHDIIIKPGSSTTTQGFEGLFFALPWLIVFGLLGWLGYIILLAWREPFTKD